jgi:hypothetical protein
LRVMVRTETLDVGLRAAVRRLALRLKVVSRRAILPHPLLGSRLQPFTPVPVFARGRLRRRLLVRMPFQSSLLMP